MNEAATTATPLSMPGRRARFARRVGVAAFMFFLIKGLLWLAVPAIVWSQTR